jgi:hypothetical protein
LRVRLEGAALAGLLPLPLLPRWSTRAQDAPAILVLLLLLLLQ